MKLYEVEWSNNVQTANLLMPQGSYGLMTFKNSYEHKKAFSTKEKAEEFRKSLYDAAQILNLNTMSASVVEVEIE